MGAGGRQRPGAAGRDQGGQRRGPSDEYHVRPAAALPVRQPGGHRRPLKQAADLGIDRIWVDALNPRPRVWPAIADLLRAKFPELLQPYRKILFNQAARTQYLKELRGRVELAASRASVAERVAACM